MGEPWWADRPGVFALGAPASAPSVQDAATAAGLTVYVVPPVTSKAEFLDALAAALGFPPWYGRNWDAAAELLADLGWLPERHPVLVWTDPARLAACDPDAHRTVLDILAGAGATRGLVVLLVDG